jgi:hypothetical protein
MSLPNGLPFSKLWKTPHDGTNAFTNELIAKITKSYGIMGVIHLCPDIKPGMKAPDIRRLLLGSSGCLDGFKFIPAQSN